jgi:hypothetical protein
MEKSRFGICDGKIPIRDGKIQIEDSGKHPGSATLGTVFA